MEFIGACLITKDVPALSIFYARVFDCAPEGDEHHAEFRFGDVGLAIYSYVGMDDMAPGCMARAGHGGVTLMFEVQDIEAEYQRIQSLGIPLLKPLQSHPWGARSFWFRDPDGNIVDFVLPPK
jgi:predicted enzyme related to lactoylglutathione lyase